MTITAKIPETTDYNKYMSTHSWIARHYGRANSCSNNPQHTGPNFQWANVTGVYEKDVDNFKQLCRSCHAKLDMTEHSRRVSKEKAINNSYASKPVVQMTKDDIVVRQYSSLTEASKSVGVRRSAISNCLIGYSMTSGGFKWRTVQ